MFSKQTVFLVVDDFEPMRKITSGQLRAMGAGTVVTANNGLEALRLLKRQRIDIVLSDWNMPVMGGLELLNAVRSDTKLSHLPFIMITAEAERYRIEEAIACGVSDLLVKPYTADRLATRIETALTAQPRPRKIRHNQARRLPKVNQLASMEAKDELVAEVPAASTMEAVRPTILVVDDTADNLLLISHLFKDEYRIRIAHNGQKALAICHSEDPPDLVLLDIMMPGMDGFEVAQRMREHPSSETIPVIFVTAMTSDDARLRGMNLGAVDFVTKPIDPEILKPRVRNFMRYVALHKQMQANCDNMLELARLHDDVEHITRHDIKGPLAGVIGLVRELETDPSTGREQREQLKVVEETTLQVLDMINLSSELFKIETGHFTLDAKPVKIGEILHRIVDIARTTFESKELTIAMDTDTPIGAELPLVMGDAMLCYSILQNLIKNACEAAPGKSRISVVVHDETPLRITIQNMGVVPMGIRERFFGKFVTQGKKGGSGLGAYSAKLLTEAQNGSISLAVSDQKKQTTITMTLPSMERVQHSTESASHS